MGILTALRLISTLIKGNWRAPSLTRAVRTTLALLISPPQPHYPTTVTLPSTQMYTQRSKPSRRAYLMQLAYTPSSGTTSDFSAIPARVHVRRYPEENCFVLH